MKTLIINSSNVVANTNNSVYRYTFPAGAINFNNGEKLSLGSVQMYYSTFNITSAQNNNQFSYIWIDGREISITIPDGFYDISSLNDFIHFVMVQQGHYLVDTNGNYYYFITFVINTSTYSVNINTYPISLSLYPLATYSLGSYTTAQITTSSPVTPVAWSIPTATVMPMVRILSNKFRDIIGYSTGYYPQGQTGYSTTVPTTELAQATITTTSNTVFNGVFTAGSTTMTCTSQTFTTGQIISSSNTAQGTYITVGGTGTSFTLSQSALTSGTVSTTAFSMGATQSPSYTTIQTFSSTATPQVSPLSSFVLTCNLLNNNLAVPNSLLYSFTPQANFGEQFTISPNQLAFIDIQKGQYTNFEVSFLDQNLFPVSLKDNNLVILLVIAEKDEFKM